MRSVLFLSRLISSAYFCFVLFCFSLFDSFITRLAATTKANSSTSICSYRPMASTYSATSRADNNNSSSNNNCRNPSSRNNSSSSSKLETTDAPCRHWVQPVASTSTRSKRLSTTSRSTTLKYLQQLPQLLCVRRHCLAIIKFKKKQPC